MRSGKFRAQGIELENSSDWRLIVGLVGIFQLFVYVTLSGLRIIPVSSAGFGVSVTLFVASFPALWYLRRNQGAGEYEVEWKVNRESDGELEITYQGPKGKKRAGLVVNKIDARPNEPLFVGGYSRNRPVVALSGTEASLIMSFKNERKFSLGVGFSNREKMEEVYEQLK